MSAKRPRQGGQKVKLPTQLVSLIQGEEKALQADGYLLDSVMDDGERSANRITLAAQERNVRELSSYVRAVCMRMGFVS
jgi:hypothetical protein